MTERPLEPSLVLADAICTRADQLAELADRQLAASGRRLEFRDRVLLGLARKIDSTFRALIDDARLGRAEAMHHLKTITEAFICFYAAGADQTMANRLIAKAVDQQKKTLEDQGAPASEVAKWAAMRDSFLGELDPLPSIEQLARNHSTELRGWYANVYRVACEPAHLGDLVTFMPKEPAILGILETPHAQFYAEMAVHYGSHIMLEVLKRANENDLGVTVPLADLSERLAALAEEERKD